MNEPARLHLVSIIVAVRNAQTTLERTLVSALSQTYPNKEIVLIDGASTDGTMEIVKKYSDRLAVIISERDRGIADAYNKGIARSSGEWVYFLNADDVFMALATFTSAVLPHRPTVPRNTTAPTPAGFQCNGLDSSPFARRYSGNRSCFLFLRVLRWFSSPRSPPPPMDSGTVTRA